MANDLNVIIVIGRLTRDPEIKYTASGTPVANISIANNKVFTSNGQKTEQVNYFDISVFGNSAINCGKYLKKGSVISVTGELKQDRWQDSQTGQTKSRIRINANNVQFLSSKQEAPGVPQQPQQQKNNIPQQNANNINNQFSGSQQDYNPDDIPF